MLRGRAHKAGRYIGLQREALHLRLGIAELLLSLMPYSTLNDLRSHIYRLAGFRGIGRRVYIAGKLDLRGDGDIYSRLYIGEHTTINTPCQIELNAEVRVGKRVGIGHNTVIITSNHELGSSTKRMSRITTEPVTIGDGAWVGARVTILPGVTIGPGAMVVVGSVLARDVPANAKVAGNPAKVIGWLDGPPD